MTGRELFGALTRLTGLLFLAYGGYMVIGFIIPAEGFGSWDYLLSFGISIFIGAFFFFAADTIEDLAYRKNT